MICSKTITEILASITLLVFIIEMIFIISFCDKWVRLQIFLARVFIVGSFLTIVSLIFMSFN